MLLDNMTYSIVYCSLTLNESTDVTDSAQMLYFKSFINEDFDCFEELLYFDIIDIISYYSKVRWLSQG